MTVTTMMGVQEVKDVVDVKFSVSSHKRMLGNLPGKK